MASTPNPNPSSSISIKSAARKLPIKRKSPDSHTPQFPKLEPHSFDESSDHEPPINDLNNTKPPPFKFHRIWTEIDEIRFLQGLLDSAPLGLLFPRDLPLFYAQFSSSTPQPYTKSQLSEKLRRLRKKFRVISSRISRGLDPSLLSPHDRALFDLSKQLWAPEFASSSPFNANCKKSKGNCSSSSSRVRVGFDPNLVGSVKSEDLGDDVDEEENCCEEEVGINGGHEERLNLFGDFGGVDRVVAAKAVMDVFDKCLNEARSVLVRRGLLYPDQRSNGCGTATEGLLSKEEKEIELMRRWREQRVAELDALARRLRLVLENSVIHDQ